jgi:hypothetical protein
MKTIIKIILIAVISGSVLFMIPDLALPLYDAVDDFMGTGIVLLVQSVYSIIPEEVLNLGAMQIGVLGIRLILSYLGVHK